MAFESAEIAKTLKQATCNLVLVLSVTVVIVIIVGNSTFMFRKVIL